MKQFGKRVAHEDKTENVDYFNKAFTSWKFAHKLNNELTNDEKKSKRIKV